MNCALCDDEVYALWRRVFCAINNKQMMGLKYGDDHDVKRFHYRKVASVPENVLRTLLPSLFDNEKGPRHFGRVINGKDADWLARSTAQWFQDLYTYTEWMSVNKVRSKARRHGSLHCREDCALKTLECC